MVVPVDKIADFLGFVRRTGDAELGLTVRNFGHAGDGNLHIYSCLNEDDKEKFLCGYKPITWIAAYACAPHRRRCVRRARHWSAKKKYLRQLPATRPMS